MVDLRGLYHGLDGEQERLLHRLLDLHASPEGSLVAHRRGSRLAPEDLAAVAALAAAVRCAAAMPRGRWPQDLPPVLALLDHILDRAGAA
ncbi:hypothetical protein [Kitasatospora sp. NPDC059571]|uniref:hypothetical protein n=1 Tax=Kitasatospora sp. NPDC059571 TaxID=3346871 RepID=UPI0036CCF9C8